MKIVNQVSTTNDYSVFSKMSGNRDVNMAHKNRLKKSIEEKSLQVPIIVNEKHQIIDGQTRFECWKELKKPITYIKVNGYGLQEVQRLNSNIRNWSLKDFTDCYCDLGNAEYIKYRAFKNHYGFDDYSSIALLQGNYSGSGSNFNKFRNGRFKIKSYKVASIIAQNILEVGKFYEKGYKRRGFVFALLHMFRHPQFKLKQLLNKLSFQSTKLVDCTKKEQYIALLNEIYNFKQAKKVDLINVYE